MLELIVTAGQALCLMGYLYGAYVVITNSDAFTMLSQKKAPEDTAAFIHAPHNHRLNLSMRAYPEWEW